MHDLSQRILEFRKQGRPALLPYLMAGDGGLDQTARLIALYEASDVAAIEIGIPFSDPVADGPVIQAAGLRAMESGVTIQGVLAWMQGLPKPKVPRIVMTYLNPIMRMGVDHFFQEARKASVSAVIIPDLPLEEMTLCTEAANASSIPMIPLASPHTSAERLNEILKLTDGFIYAVTVSGVTGAREGFSEALKARLSEIKQNTPLPVVAGFGISSPAHVSELKPYCDGFVIGSKLVDMAHQGDFDGIQRFLAEAGAQ